MFDLEEYLKKKWLENPLNEDIQTYVPTHYLNKIIVSIFEHFIYRPDYTRQRPGYITEGGLHSNKYTLIQSINSNYNGSLIGSAEFFNIYVKNILRDIEDIKYKLIPFDKTEKITRYFSIDDYDINRIKEECWKEVDDFINRNNIENQTSYGKLSIEFDRWLQHPTIPINIVNIDSEEDIKYLETLYKIIKGL